MSNRNAIFLLIALLIVVISTSLLVKLNNKKADYSPPTFVSDSGNHNLKIQEADAIYATGKFQEALKIYEQILVSYPKNFPLLHKIGKINLQLGNYSKAEDVYTRLCKRAPDNEIFQSSLSLSLLELEKYDKALIHANKAIKLVSKDGLPFLVKAAVKASQNKADEALETFTRIQPTAFLVGFLATKHFDPIRKNPKFAAFEKAVNEQFPRPKK